MTITLHLQNYMRNKNGNFYIPLNKDGKEQSGTKDSMIVVFDGRSETCL